MWKNTRDPKPKLRDEVFICTNLKASAEQIIEWFVMRCWVAPPFTALQRQYLRYWLARKREIEGVSPSDIEILNRLVDEESPDYFLKRDDLIFTAVSFIYAGIA